MQYSVMTYKGKESENRPITEPRCYTPETQHRKPILLQFKKERRT